MVGPLANIPLSADNRIEPGRERNQSVHVRPGDSNDPAWFLPQGSSSLQTISATEDPNLQGASPDSVASRILSHIGA